MQIKYFLYLSSALLTVGFFDRFELESLVGFLLALVIGFGGKIANDSKTKKITYLDIIRGFFLSLLIAFLVDGIAYEKNYSSTMRVNLVCFFAFLSDFVVVYIIKNYKKIINKIFSK